MAPQTRVLVCFDDSPGGIAAVATAARLFPGAPAVVVHAWRRTPLTGYSYSQVMLPLEIQTDLDTEMAQHSNEIADKGASLARAAGLDAQPSSRESEGPVWQELIAAAKAENAEVIVMGSRGFGEMKALLLGSTSSAVAHHSKLPVLIVPPGEA